MGILMEKNLGIFFFNLGMYLHCQFARRLKKNNLILLKWHFEEGVCTETNIIVRNKPLAGICVWGNYWNYLHAYVNTEGSAPTLTDC